MEAVKETNTGDLPEKKFGSPGGAYRWACEIEAIPDCKGNFDAIRGQLMGGTGGGRFHFGDFRELAYSITACVAGVRDDTPLGYAMFTFVYGDKGVAQADSLASSIAQRGAPDLQYSIAKRMAQTALRRVKADVRGERLPGRAQYARDIGIRQPSLYSGRWQRTIDALEETAWGFLRAGRTSARERLAPLGVLD